MRPPLINLFSPLNQGSGFVVDIYISTHSVVKVVKVKMVIFDFGNAVIAHYI